MDWSNERYVRLYTRDTVDWMALPWQSRALFPLLLRKADRAGIIEVGKHGAKGLAVMVHLPFEVVEVGLEGLLADGSIEGSDGALVIPNFIEAQESRQSDKQRAKESRERRRDRIRKGLDASARETVLYFIQSEHGGPVKIGHASDMAKRIQGLQTSRPDNLVVIATAPAMLADEKAVHDAFADLREKGEWFTGTDELMAYAKHVAETHEIGDPVSFRNAIRKDVTSRETSRVTARHSVPCRAVPSLAMPSPLPPDGGPGGSSDPMFTKGATAIRASEVYSDALTEALGKPFARQWTTTDYDALCVALNTLANADSHALALAWLHSEVVAWVGAVPEAERRFTGGWKPARFVDWINNGRPSGPAKPGGSPTKSDPKPAYLREVDLDVVSPRGPVAPWPEDI